MVISLLFWSLNVPIHNSTEKSDYYYSSKILLWQNLFNNHCNIIMDFSVFVFIGFLDWLSFFMPQLSHREAVCQCYETQVHRDLIIKASQTYMYTTPTATHALWTNSANEWHWSWIKRNRVCLGPWL